jgi:hypothetical protein
MGTNSIVKERYSNINTTIKNNNDISNFEPITKSFQNINYSRKNKMIKNEKTRRFSTIFRWDGEAVRVYLTGSFCNWHQFFQMEKSQKQNDKFYLTLFLPKGVYQYKFKIDDKWKYNSNFPTCSDKNGNINNVIDLTEEKKDNEDNTDFSTSFITKEENSMSEEVKLDSSRKKIDEKFSDYLPMKKEIKEMPQESPLLYNSFFNYDFLSNQKKIRRNSFLQSKEQNILSENYSYKKILPLQQEKIDHLNINRNILNKSINHQSRPIISASTCRYKYKFITYIYYRPSIKDS